MVINLAEFRLEDVSSFIRNIDSECTLACIHEDNVIVGSKEGELVCWSISSGIEKWNISFEGPCSELKIYKNNIYLTEEGNIHSINLIDGEISWSLVLEGLTDFIQIYKDQIWISSSIYDLHISNYSDSIIWRIDETGNILEKWPIEGKPWFLGSTEYGICVGLSRPKCGYAKICIGKSVDYVSLKNIYPITAGLQEEGYTYLGHSDGKVSVINRGIEKEIDVGETAVSSLGIVMGKLFIAMESGDLMDSKGEYKYNLDGVIDGIVSGPGANECKFLWVICWSKICKISAINTSRRTIDININHDFRIRKMDSDGEILVLGDSNGKIFLIEENVLMRRLKFNDITVEKDERRTLLKEKLRRMRT